MKAGPFPALLLVYAKVSMLIFTVHQKLHSVMVFGSNGIALNLAKKALKRYQSTLCGRTHSDSITKIRLSLTLCGLSYVGIRE